VKAADDRPRRDRRAAIAPPGIKPGHDEREQERPDQIVPVAKVLAEFGDLGRARQPDGDDLMREIAQRDEPSADDREPAVASFHPALPASLMPA
jgi:hypothetical protein